jgi:DNA-binding NtrC family response regulator
MPWRGGTETIPPVDDEGYIRELGEKMLARFGYTLLTAKDGESALGIYCNEQERIDLVVLDLIIPGIGGKRCLEQLLKMNAQVRVVISSSFSPEGPTKEMLNAGTRGFIGKPYDLRQMMQEVWRVLDVD